MPNWAEGTMKLRGKKKDVEQFIRDNIIFVTRVAGKDVLNDEYRERPVEISWDGDETLELEQPSGLTDCLWVKDTQRTFIDFDTYCCGFELYDGKAGIPVYYFGGRDEEDPDILLVLPYKAAWSVHDETEEIFRKRSEEYHLRIRIYVVESGWGFFQTCTFNNGVTEESKVLPEKRWQADIGDARYSEFVWECPVHWYGG